MISHGASAFTKDRIYDSSDNISCMSVVVECLQYSIQKRKYINASIVTIQLILN